MSGRVCERCGVRPAGSGVRYCDVWPDCGAPGPALWPPVGIPWEKVPAYVLAALVLIVVVGLLLGHHPAGNACPAPTDLGC